MMKTTKSAKPLTAYEAGYVLCRDCHSINRQKYHLCYRCQAPLFSRRPNSLQIAWAWLLTAVVLIFPANIYPITIVYKFGVAEPDTIMSGVLKLVEKQMYPIALIVFVASIIVPGVKVIGLFYIFLSVHLKAPLSHKKITGMFHFIEWIGRWSMLDLFVISLMMVLVEMGHVTVEAGPATIAFGLLVFTTMLSSQAFDSRLLWDKEIHQFPAGSADTLSADPALAEVDAEHYFVQVDDQAATGDRHQGS